MTMELNHVQPRERFSGSGDSGIFTAVTFSVSASFGAGKAPFLSWRLRCWIKDASLRRQIVSTPPAQNAPSLDSSRRWYFGSQRFFFHDAHRHARHAAHDFGLRGIVKSPHVLVGVRMGNDDQLPTVNLTPAAHIAVPELHEINGTIEFGFPSFGSDLLLAG